MAQVIAILPEGFEEIEAITPIDLLRRAGITVRIVALGSEMHVTGRTSVTVHTEGPLHDRDLHTAWDLVFLPGGPGVKHLRADPRVRELVQRQAQAGRWLAAICAAPTVLADAGVLKGHRYTCHFSVAPEMPDRLAAERVVIDRKIITSRGAGTAVDFGLALVGLLAGEKASSDVAGAIMA
ncbi:DJ-1 family glyoxalase III [Nibricoccus sp. IMCC34717]|uniref:DJ-1 family glyoxalase III n=1 Tax=Nibricoccus sp. IMCC34717 TaxID=3034021 RepID=UPI00384BE6D4